MSQPDDYQAALAQGYLPIREVARSTGVNPVTLRAWERRYGLVVPYRTPKGHRLYSQDHVARIQAILTWLARGVAVGQVKELLEQRVPASAAGSNLWDELRQAMLQSIERQAERQLDEHFNRALALYPPHTLCQQLLLPLLEDLDQRWHGAPFGAQLQRVFFHSWLRSKLGARLYHHNRQQHGAPLLLVNLSSLPLEPNLWLCAWLASSAGCPVEVYDWPMPLAELAIAVDNITPRALLLYASQALDAAQIRRELPRLNSACAVPLLLAGPAAQIHADELHNLPGLHLATGPMAADRLLHQQQLL
ncbi:MerR family transcriptional regulator [Aquipseudomonas guryensis]|jgi:DNA-binding transcriptional MerR regulator|uniref:MerR family transcriptional regulator n=1 Tax=Aquipseudomonas guryensis TaxID=2759165 RepID=A0A7W4DEX6_9GAMM|nr:MerR family transcriptional regulator [Pseudomonas guryensis]MBB1521329.1 MerR family transcriptional regulator [Pseudomonas guryensis]